MFASETNCATDGAGAYLSSLNAVHPAGRMLSSMKVFKKTVVARSFQGRPVYCALVSVTRVIGQDKPKKHL